MQIMLRLAQRYRGVAYHSIGERQLIGRLGHDPSSHSGRPARMAISLRQNRTSDLPFILCPKGKFAGGTTGAHKMQCGPRWPPVVTYAINHCNAVTFTIALWLD